MNVLGELSPGCRLDGKDIVRLLTLEGQEADQLFKRADEIRKEFCGDEVFLRGIIEFSNVCGRNCSYCGINVGNRGLKRYSMGYEEILATAQKIKEAGILTVVLQSGENLVYPPDLIAGLVAKLKEMGLAVTLSLGEKKREVYRLWREAGADRYLLKFETSDPELYRLFHPGHEVKERFQCLEWLREEGYQVGSGFMVGLPGQDYEVLARDILALVSIIPDMAGIGPFLPHPATPLAGCAPGDPETTLKVLAITRIMLPLTHLPATTALYSAEHGTRVSALNCGANVIMPNFTPATYRQWYEIYPAKAEVLSTPDEVLAEIKEELARLGRFTSASRGDSLIIRFRDTR